MNYLRFLLFPFALLYGLITIIRNALYDKRIYYSSEYDFPLIGVGNLSMGGTGKTPHVEYLIKLLAPSYLPATLSRGYKRATSGFVLADEQATAASIGDEPFQYHFKFPELAVAVAENRVFGVAELLSAKPETQVLILDDVFQHRALKPGFQLLITDYKQLFTTDYLIPMGRLRELRRGASRADVIVVSKCPSTITLQEQENIRKAIAKYSTATVHFSFIKYLPAYPLFAKEVLELNRSKKIILVAGIAYPKAVLDELMQQGYECIPFSFSDHYNFRLDDLERIKRVVMQHGNSLSAFQLLTTEKDAMRLLPYKDWFLENDIPLWVQPIAVEFKDSKFDEQIFEYVKRASED